jgi:hypothetical protein
VAQEQLQEIEVAVQARGLSPAEAIGEPGRRDFPLLVGKERVIEATVLGSRGQAFTDAPREFQGTLAEVMSLALDNNRDRAVFVATLNALLVHLGMVQGTLHCRDDDPELCAAEIEAQLRSRTGATEVGLIGLNPAIAERLVAAFGVDHVRISDLDRDHIGTVRHGVEIWDGGARVADLVAASHTVLVTGTTLVNGTCDQIWRLVQEYGTVCLFYGVTAAGACELLGLDRICPFARDGRI